MLCLLTFLVPDIAPDHLFLRNTDCLGKIPVRPKAVAPQKLFQFRKLFPQSSTRSTLEYLYYGRHALLRPNLNQQMYVVRLNAQLLNFPPVDLRRLEQQPLQTANQFPSQNSLAIFGNPNQVIFESMPCMRSGPVGHRQSMPQTSSARQSSRAPGSASSPALKGWGFRASVINPRIYRDVREGMGKQER